MKSPIANNINELRRYKLFSKKVKEMADIYGISEDSVWIALDLMFGISPKHEGVFRDFRELFDWVGIHQFVAHHNILVMGEDSKE